MIACRMFISSVLAVVVVAVWTVCPARAELLIHYEFDEGLGSSADDASSPPGAAHDGLFTSMPSWSNTDKAPISNNAASVMLNDDANRVTTGDADDLEGLKSFTAMMWVKDEPTGDNNYPRMMDKASSGAIWFKRGGGSLSSVQLDFYTYDSIVAPWPGLSMDGWHHWAVVFDGTKGESGEALATFYFDANPFHSGYIDVSVTPVTSSDFYVANRSDAARALSNRFDDFRFYGSQSDGSGALTRGQILQISEIPEPTTAMLLLLGGLLMLLWVANRRG